MNECEPACGGRCPSLHDIWCFCYASLHAEGLMYLLACSITLVISNTTCYLHLVFTVIVSSLLFVYFVSCEWFVHKEVLCDTVHQGIVLSSIEAGHSGFGAGVGLPRDVMGSLGHICIVMALRQTVSDCDAFLLFGLGFCLSLVISSWWRRGWVQLPASCGSSIGAAF
jgi:hypothetical protein